MIAAARIAAYEVLVALWSDDIDLPAALERARAGLPDARDRALVTELATGVQRHRATLDHLIAHFTRRPVDHLDPEVLEILRLSVYQLIYLSRVPAAAAVDDGVQLTRRVRKASAAGLVNAALRALSRRRHDLPLPPRPDTPADRDRVLDYLSVTHSHPRWLVERWLDRIGLERTELWVRFNNRPAPLTLRANTLRSSVAEVQADLASRGVKTVPGRWAPEALIVDADAPRDLVMGLTHAVLQDEASQLVPLLLGPQPGPRVLDACASPGGKTIALAAAAGPRSFVVACDVRDRRMRLLRQTIDRARASTVRLVQADFRHRPPFLSSFHSVLVDAPCSGLGVLRREPDLKWRRHPSDLARLADLQLQLLTNAAQVVAPAGRLVYATCSSEPVENEDVAERFVAASPEFSRVGAHQSHPGLSPDLLDDHADLRTTPDRHGLELFFGTVFERRPR